MRVWMALEGVLLGGVVLLGAALSVAMVRLPSEVMYGEAIVYAHARRLLEGVPLYQPIDRFPYGLVTYPPAFYVLMAGVQRFGGDGFAPGRVIALASIVGCGALVWVLARGRWAGLVAALLFLALGLPGSGLVPWTALYKEDSLALLFALGSVALVARAPGSLAVVVFAGVLAALATLTKQTLGPLALAPLAVFAWQRDLRTALVFGGVALLPVLAVSAWYQATTGAYLDNILATVFAPTPPSWLAWNLALLLMFQIGPLLAAGAYWRCLPRAPDDFLLGVAWAASVLPMSALAKEGGASNHWMGFAALTAVFAGRYLTSAKASRGLSVLAVLAIAGSSAIAVAAWSRSLTTLTHENSTQFAALVERVRQTNGEVITDPLDVAVLAGRPPLFEPLQYPWYLAAGRWSAQPVLDARLALVVTDRPIDEMDWPDPIRASLLQRMRLESEQAGRLVYTPAT